MIISKIKSEQLQARKDQDKFKTKVLTALYSETAIVGKNNGNRETNDDEAIAVIKSFIKKLNETISILKQNPNKDVSEQLSELSIYESFLPKQLSEEEIKNIVLTTIKTIENPSIKSMGAVMSVLNTEYKGLFDGSVASKIVKEELSKGF